MLIPGNRNWTFDVNDPTSLDLVNLSPNTEYKISVLGYNINGEGEVKSVPFKTKGILLNFAFHISIFAQKCSNSHQELFYDKFIFLEKLYVHGLIC